MDVESVALIGFGEAGQAFAPHLAVQLTVYDSATDDPGLRAAKLEQASALGLGLARSNRDAVAGASAILSLVTADQAVAVAVETIRAIEERCFYFDMNSVAPDSKREAAKRIEGAGGRYVDVAVLAPVLPVCMGVPLLLSGEHADEGAAILGRIGFTRVRIVPGDVGRASTIKMLRSVVVKGVEALTAECVLAAEMAGVLDEVLASLDASASSVNWAVRADYALDRMMVHGIRRAAEMEEVVKTLDALGTGSAMSRATAARQRGIGGRAPLSRGGLNDKLTALLGRDTGKKPA